MMTLNPPWDDSESTLGPAVGIFFFLIVKWNLNSIRTPDVHHTRHIEVASSHDIAPGSAVMVVYAKDIKTDLAGIS
jgi:hypothetical protein